jgi:hypothetical protein
MKHHKLRLVILCLLLVAVLTVSALAASPCVVSIQGGSTAKPGQSITLAVEITGNPGFTNFDFGIEYDRSVLTLDSIQTKQELPLPDGSTAESPYLCGGMAVVNLQYIDRENPSALLGYVSAIHTQNVKRDGTLFTMTFTVKESAAGGSTSIAIKPFAFADEQQNALSASYSPATLTIDAPQQTPSAGPDQGQGSGQTSNSKTSAVSMDNFSLTDAYPGYSDVDESKWYGTQKQGVVRQAVRLGIMAGRGHSRFAPDDSITLAEVVKMAAVTHSIYMGDGYVFDQKQGEHWWDTYLTYAVFSGILSAKDFADLQQTASRAQMAHVFARALPETELEALHTNVNIPDVSDSAPYAAEIRLLYQAGVLQGRGTDGRFAPDSNISRAEAAAIIARVALKTARS